MFNFLRKKDVSLQSIQENDIKINFTAREALDKTLEKLYNPSYEQIKKDIVQAIKNKQIYI